MGPRVRPHARVTIRDAVPDDAVAMGRIKRDGWRAAYHGLIPDAVLDGLEADELAANFGRRLAELAADAHPDSSALVATVDTALVGYVNLGPYRWDDLADAGEVYALYVDPARWRGGVGKALMAGAEARLRVLGYQRSALWVLEENQLGRRFYESVGWKADGASGERCEVENAKEVRYRRELTGT